PANSRTSGQNHCFGWASPATEGKPGPGRPGPGRTWPKRSSRILVLDSCQVLANLADQPRTTINKSSIHLNEAGSSLELSTCIRGRKDSSYPDEAGFGPREFCQQGQHFGRKPASSG